MPQDGNITLLTLRCAEAMSLRVAGYIVNHPLAAADIATQTNVRSLAHLTEEDKHETLSEIT